MYSKSGEKSCLWGKITNIDHSQAVKALGEVEKNAKELEMLKLKIAGKK